MRKTRMFTLTDSYDALAQSAVIVHRARRSRRGRCWWLQQSADLIWWAASRVPVGGLAVGGVAQRVARSAHERAGGTARLSDRVPWRAVKRLAACPCAASRRIAPRPKPSQPAALWGGA